MGLRRYRPVNFKAVELIGKFWSERLDVNKH
jgi:hypothetical protein